MTDQRGLQGLASRDPRVSPSAVARIRPARRPGDGPARPGQKHQARPAGVSPAGLARDLSRASPGAHLKAARHRTPPRAPRLSFRAATAPSLARPTTSVSAAIAEPVRALPHSHSGGPPRTHDARHRRPSARYRHGPCQSRTQARGHSSSSRATHSTGPPGHRTKAARPPPSVPRWPPTPCARPPHTYRAATQSMRAPQPQPGRLAACPQSRDRRRKRAPLATGPLRAPSSHGPRRPLHPSRA